MIDFFLADLSSGVQERDVGANCTALNQCKSKFCAQCPGDTHGMCYEGKYELPLFFLSCKYMMTFRYLHEFMSAKLFN